jgi:hypothetical protein
MEGGSEMSETPTPETDAYIMQSYSPTGLQWRCFARKLERERDEARRDLVALEELHRRRFGTLRKELAASNRGAKTNAKVNQGLCSRLTEAERERDEARRECNEAQDGWSRALDERDDARKERDSALKERDAVWNSWSKALDEAREELSRVRKELVSANRGAERNAHINNSLCSKLIQAERERGDALKGEV